MQSVAGLLEVQKVCDYEEQGRGNESKFDDGITKFR